MLENYHEETDFDKEIENYPKEKLIDIVENGADIELMEAAFQKLSFIDEDYALTKGMEFLRNDEFCLNAFNINAAPAKLDCFVMSIFAKEDVDMGSMYTASCIPDGIRTIHMGIWFRKRNIQLCTQRQYR